MTAVLRNRADEIFGNERQNVERTGRQTRGKSVESVRPPFPILLSDRWRVVFDDLQWILQHRQARKSNKSSGWCGRSFCTTRGVLKRDIRRLAGDVDPAALAIIDGLPDQHPHYGPGHC